MHSEIKKTDKRLEKGIASRKQIIDAAIKCIATRGLCDTTLDRIAEIAKVSRALVIFHFKSKKGMLIAVLEEISDRYNTQWQIIMSQGNLSDSQRLLKLLAFDVRLPIENPEIITVWHTFWGDANGLYKEFNLTRDEKFDNDLFNLIISITTKGEYQQVNPKHVSIALVAMLLGLWWNAHLNPIEDHYERSMEVVKSYLQLCFPRHF